MVTNRVTRSISVALLLVSFQICLTAGCNYILSSDSESGWFTSPGHPKKYPNNVKCSWLITAKNPILIAFQRFYTWNTLDVLKIYDGPTNSSSLLLEHSGRSIPPPVLSTTNHILVTFNSDKSRSHSGFNATYSSFGCQHCLTSESGWFSSQNFSLNYPNDTSCRWLINITKPINFSFPEFQLENSNHWLTIYDGPTESSEILLEASSKSQIPSSVETTIGQALVVFKSDKSESRSQFNITYEPKCKYALSSESGSINSPTLKRTINNPDVYCSWLINATQPISLSFTKQVSSKNRVKVYDGSSTSAVELFDSTKFYSSTSLLISSTNQMLILFSSKASAGFPFSSFSASYQPSGCQEMTSDSGWFTSPNHPLNYPDNSTSCWLIKTKNPIMLSFTSFHLEEYRDWLTVYKGQSTAEEFSKLSSNNTNTALIIPGTNQILVTFTSNESNNFSGFNATYSPSSCQEISLPDGVGWFTTPNHPSNYPNNLKICWLIKATQPIKLTFSRFEVEEKQDVLSVYDGSITGDVFLEISSNSIAEYPSVISRSNQMLVTFTSDASGSFSGFNATYEPYECRQVLSSKSGLITLRDSPHDASIKFNCSWLINTTNPIILVITELYVIKNEDSLTIYDGPTTSSALLFNSSVNESSVYRPISVISTNNQMLLLFTSNGTETYSLPCSHFKAHYSSYECQHYLSSESGWISSPSYPLNYPDDINCRWLINAKQLITFLFPQFHLENDKDWLTIYDGLGESSKILLNSSSNSQIPSFVETSTNQALVVFKSDKSGSRSGFNVTYEPLRCQYVLSSESGTFQSPRFYEGTAINCSWLINTTQPTIFSFGCLELDADYDLITIKDGPTFSKILLETSSYDVSPVVSTNHPVLITFTSTSIQSSSRFIAKFSPSHIQSSDSESFTSHSYPAECWGMLAN